MGRLVATDTFIDLGDHNLVRASDIKAIVINHATVLPGEVSWTTERGMPSTYVLVEGTGWVPSLLSWREWRNRLRDMGHSIL